MVHSSTFVVALAGIAAAAPAQYARVEKRQSTCTVPENATLGSAALCSFVCNDGFSFVNGLCEAVASTNNAKAAAASPSSPASSASVAAASVAASSASPSAAQQPASSQSQAAAASQSTASAAAAAPAASSAQSGTNNTPSSSSSSSSSSTGNAGTAASSGSSSSSSVTSSNGSDVASSIGPALGGGVVGSDGVPYTTTGGSSSSSSAGSSSGSSSSQMALSGQVSGFPFISRLNGTVAELITSGIRGFLGNNTNAIASWFRTNNPGDFTNGHSWCYYPYNDTSPGFDVSLRTMVANFGNDTMAARRAYCGLEANIYSPRTNKNVTLYVVDAFDDTWVKTPTSMDVVIGAFPLLWDNQPANTTLLLNKNDVIYPVSWQWTGNRHPDYVFGGPGVGPRTTSN